VISKTVRRGDHPLLDLNEDFIRSQLTAPVKKAGEGFTPYDYFLESQPDDSSQADTLEAWGE
jgi:hypothetical protein